MKVPKFCPYCGDVDIMPSQSKGWLKGWVVECPNCGEIKIGDKMEEKDLEKHKEKEKL